MSSFKNKTILITGAGKRLGKELALFCHAQGANLRLHANTSKREVELLADEVNGSFVISDFRKLADEGADAITDGVDYIIHNASTYSSNTFDTIAPQTYVEDQNINALAPLTLTSALYRKKLCSNTFGGVIFFLDARERGIRNRISYFLSKSVLKSAMPMLAREFAPVLRVNAIMLGSVLPEDTADSDSVNLRDAATLFGKCPNVSDLCNAVHYLLTTPNLTNQTLYVDSGRHLRD